MLPPPPRAPWIEPSSHRGGGRSERPRFNKNSVHSVRQRSRAESGRTDFQSDWLGDLLLGPLRSSQLAITVIPRLTLNFSNAPKLVIRAAERFPETGHSNPIVPDRDKYKPQSNRLRLHRDFEIANAIALGFMKMTRAYIDLDRGQQQPKHWQCRITGFAHRDKTVFIHAITDMDACPPLSAYGRFPTIVIAARSLIVVTQKQAGFIN